MWKDIFFIPPIREAWQVKSMYKWLNRWSITWIYIENIWKEEKNFLENEIKQEHFLPITLAKILNYNYEDLWFLWEKTKFEINY